MPKPNKYLDYTDHQIESLINRVYHGKIDVHNLPKDLYSATVSKLSDAVVQGMAGTVHTLETRDAYLQMHFLHNTAVFSAAKTFQQVDAMQNSIFQGGERVSLSDFKVSARAIFDDFNENWLESEFNTASASAFAGKAWNSIIKDKETLPLLKYSTVEDDRVRPEHAEMDDIILPVDDPFWDTNYPPNGFNCRCTVDQLEGDAEQTVLSGEERDDLVNDVPKLFQMNSGKDKLIFKEDHPYFNVADRYEKLKENNFNLPVPAHPRDYVDED